MSRGDPSHDPLLSGIRIIELARGIAGPFATRVLAELGADVVKVECPSGDPARASHPVGFATWNRSKRGVVLDIDDPAQRETLYELLARADVIVHDLPAGRAAALGLADDELERRHPHLLAASVPPYPVGHPKADLDHGEWLIQAAEGFMDEQQGHRDGPIYIRLPFAGWCAAYLLLAGIVARLIQRERTGVAAPISTSILQGGLAPAALYWQRWERLPEPPPGGHGGLGDTARGHTLPKVWPDAALSIFECADGRWVQLAGATGGWIESPPVLEALAIADQVDLSEVGVTPENRSTWNAVFRTRPSGEWVEVLRAHDVPCVVCVPLGECFRSAQATANGYVVAVDDPVQGPLLQAGTPIELDVPSGVRRPAPRLGETDVADVIAGWSPREAPTAGRRRGGEPPLAGMRVLDFGAAVAGPFGAQCLADLGAEVVKVESTAGDRSRGLTQFAGCQRGKRALAIDLKSAQAREALERLVRRSDVVLHNMRLGAAARLGIDGPGLRSINPHVVFSHISAYGTAGPMANDPGYDPTAQAMTGWEHANAGDGMPPVWLRNSIFDIQAGLASCAGALLGLLARERTGRPAEARTSLLAVGITASSELAIDVASDRPTPVDVLSADQTGVSPYQRIYRLRDGWIAVAAERPAQREALVAVLGGEDVERRVAGLEIDPTLARLTAGGVPACRVALDQMDAFFDSDANRRLGLSRTLATSGYGAIDVVAGWWRADWPERDESIPDFAEHSVEILSELGFRPDEIDALVEAGIVASRTPVGDACA